MRKFKNADEALSADLQDFKFNEIQKYLVNEHNDAFDILKWPEHFDDFEEMVHFYEQTPLITDEQYNKFYKDHVEGQYPAPAVTVDLIGLRYFDRKLQVLLVKRLHRPFKNKWAMPGGFVDYEETINKACLREVKEETNVDIDDNNLIRLPAVSAKGRDPRMWVITNPNIVLFTPNDIHKMSAQAGDDAHDLTWLDVSLDENEKLVINPDIELAFDHYQIIQNALKYLRTDFDHRRLPLMTKLLGETVTLPAMRDLFKQIDPHFANVSTSNIKRFYKNSLKDTGIKEIYNGGRRSPVFTYNMNSERL